MPNQSSPDDQSQADLLHSLRYGTDSEKGKALTRLAAVGEAEALDAVVDYLIESDSLDTAGLNTLRILANKYLPSDRYSLSEALIRFLNSGEWKQRLYAVRLLNTYPNELVLEPMRDLIDDARATLYASQENKLPTSLRVIVERTLHESILALASGGKLTVLPDILEYLDDGGLRATATRALGLINSDTERLRLEDLAEDYDPQVRDAAQWALNLMDERAEQFLNPPTQIPEPPPGRLNPLYWAHRNLFASDDSLVQFLVVRLGIENRILDQFISDGRVPEICTIILRQFQGTNIPDHRNNQSEVVGIWEYRWHGPLLRKRVVSNTNSLKRSPLPANVGRGAIITINYPDDLPFDGTGEISVDSQFQPFLGHGWLYRVFERSSGDWGFITLRQTWTT